MTDITGALDEWQRLREAAATEFHGRGDGILRMLGKDWAGVIEPDNLAARFELIRSERDLLMELDAANAMAIRALAVALAEHLRN